MERGPVLAVEGQRLREHGHREFGLHFPSNMMVSILSCAFGHLCIFLRETSVRNLCSLFELSFIIEL